jgi:hypothetical protein
MKILSILFFSLSLVALRGATITAATGNQSDVQNAINAAHPGDTVTIPAGTWTWSTGVSISQSLILQGAGSGSGGTVIARQTPVQLTNTGTWDMIGIGPSSDVPVTISGIYFENNYIGESSGNMSDVAIYGPGGGFGGTNTTGLTQILIENCTFHGGYCNVHWSNFAYGCIAHCTFLNPVYGVVFYSNADGDTDWLRPLTFGTKYAAYIENCTVTFDSNYRGNLDTFADTDRGGRLVFRYTTFNFTNITAASQPGAVLMMHGNTEYLWGGNPGNDDSWRGPVSLEVYNCTFNLPTSVSLYRLMYIRGGRGIILIIL